MLPDDAFVFLTYFTHTCVNFYLYIHMQFIQLYMQEGKLARKHQTSGETQSTAA